MSDAPKRPMDTSPSYSLFAFRAGAYMDHLEAENKRLRERLAEWVERLRWADGLTDVVEQMREEAER